MSIDFSKAPEGATHYCNSFGAVTWFFNRGGSWYARRFGSWSLCHYKVEGLSPIPGVQNDLPSRCNHPTGSNPVDGPAHYNGTVCLEAIKASMSPEAYMGYLKGNVQKYLWRYEKKVNPVEDLKKAQWYLARLVGEREDV